MLVLHRYPNQVVKITVGDIVIRVTVADVRGSKVKLGFDAPRHVQIVRDDAIKTDPREESLKK